jgi:hypothetical protein
MSTNEEIESYIQDIEGYVGEIRAAMPDYETSANSGLDAIESACSEMRSIVEKGDCTDNNPVYEMLCDLEIAQLWETYQNANLAVINDLKDALGKVLKYHGL